MKVDLHLPSEQASALIAMDNDGELVDLGVLSVSPSRDPGGDDLPRGISQMDYQRFKAVTSLLDFKSFDLNVAHGDDGTTIILDQIRELHYLGHASEVIPWDVVNKVVLDLRNISHLSALDIDFLKQLRNAAAAKSATVSLDGLSEDITETLEWLGLLTPGSKDLLLAT